MARLRLFANLREIAGTGQVEIEGETVGDVLDAATETFGTDFGRALETAQVWVDGEQADATAAVPAGAEIAVIPPVSGGAMAIRSPILIEIGLAALLAIVLFAANAVSLQWLSVAAALVGSLWAYDLAGSGERRGLALGTAPALSEPHQLSSGFLPGFSPPIDSARPAWPRQRLGRPCWYSCGVSSIPTSGLLSRSHRASRSPRLQHSARLRWCC